MEQSLSKDIRKLYTRSIIWTMGMTVVTIIVASVLLAFILRQMTPANDAENKAIEVSNEMKSNTSKYLDEQAFSKQQQALQEDDVFLSAYQTDGEKISGPDMFPSLFEETSIPEAMNENISSDGYFHQVVPIDVNDEIAGVWVYSYELKETFPHEYYRYIMLGILFLVLLSPVIYFIIFSKYFIHKLYKSMKQPLDELMAATHKIRQKDLEFQLNYHSKNELGQLTIAFQQMKEELQKTLKEKWKKDSEWAVMMSSLSHDLKTPITLIGMGTETLANDPSLSEEQKTNVEIITRNTAKANTLLESMNEAGKMNEPTTTKDEIMLTDLITEIDSDFHPLMENKSITYSCQSAATDMNITVPYIQMNRVLHNLFSNAVQYTPNGGEIILIIHLYKQYLLLALENTGKGIKKENWELVFNKHYREDPSRSNTHGNSGLGLYIAKQLIESIDGTLRVTDAKKLTGVRLEMTLPVNE